MEIHHDDNCLFQEWNPADIIHIDVKVIGSLQIYQTRDDHATLFNTNQIFWLVNLEYTQVLLRPNSWLGKAINSPTCKMEVDIYVKPYKPQLRATAIRNIRPLIWKVLAYALMSQMKSIFGGARQSKID